MKIISEKTLRTNLISVIVPCYNHEKYIEKCIESIYSQTIRNFELIVIDDGSTDSSPMIIKKLSNKYDFVYVIQENIGLCATLNKAIQNFVSGKYVTFCASDDYWLRNKLELQFQFMEDNTDLGMCFGKCHYVDLDGNLIKDRYIDNKSFRSGYIFDDIFTFKVHPPVNYMLRTEVFKSIGLYKEDVFADDYYMNLKIALNYPIGFINEYLICYRVDDGINKIGRNRKVSNSHLLTIEEYKNNPKYRHAKEMVYFRNFTIYAGYKEYKAEALDNAIRSIKLIYKLSYLKAVIKLFLLWR
jgi:glycosyltransferase involved in cell wall biosynthesis